MTHPEQPVLDAIAQLEAEENPDAIHDLVRWQLEEGRKRGGSEPVHSWAAVVMDEQHMWTAAELREYRLRPLLYRIDDPALI